MTRKLRVGVLFGGQSGEHEVSIVSARAVLANLDRDKYDVMPIGITKDGRWISGAHAPAALLAQADPKLLPGDEGSRKQEAGSSLDEQNTALMSSENSVDFLLHTSAFRLDVVIPVLHGPKGEDGTIQGLFELAGVPYVGCGVLASAVGMDKAMMKYAFSAAGFPVLPWMLVRRVDLQRSGEQIARQIEEHLRYPMFVKPANMGSSVGITRATDRATLLAGLHEAARYDRRIVVEQGINAREIEVSVLGNDDPQASVPGEIVPSKDWYDYEAKYLGGESKTIIPAPISEALAEQVRALGVAAFKAIDGAGLARVDFLLDRDTGQLYLNEVNTMPGFTPISMYAKMWEASGLSYPQLLDKLIELALERHG
jgi:D-alanine-D-alanine ligase